ncbi:hypothetical protein [Cellulophaga omnivescoria]|uniref:hypothetical protein n=1 Tax=Cellulophaga omnivescoria TaxID=1888890 RepID=UPI0022F08DF2|nr:hypothetical protein [Cellulophaga omnivescoria]WBU89732.1 hypothetical protein PBN93_01645 [Cellulophaga omnivescoria]WKB79957.1 hypothetical protein QYR09_09345 [Cellulophaga lytica]
MSYYWIILFVLVAIPIQLFIKWTSDKSKDFKELIEMELKKNGLKYVDSKYPGLFKVGPFKKFEITIGKPTINDGAIQYEHTYYRIVVLETKRKRKERIWAKIETSWFKDTRIEFKPKLSDIKK